MPISPSMGVKAGGKPTEALWTATLPSVCFDVTLEHEQSRVGFVEYLRHSFAWAGFPGYATMPALRRQRAVRIS